MCQIFEIYTYIYICVGKLLNEALLTALKKLY